MSKNGSTSRGGKKRSVSPPSSSSKKPPPKKSRNQAREKNPSLPPPEKGKLLSHGFFKLKSAKDFKTNDAEFVMVEELSDTVGVLSPPSQDDEKRASSLQIAIRTLHSDISSEEDPKRTMDIGAAGKRLEEELQQLKSKIREANATIMKVRFARDKAEKARVCWRTRNIMLHARWTVIVNAANKLLQEAESETKETVIEITDDDADAASPSSDLTIDDEEDEETTPSSALTTAMTVTTVNGEMDIDKVFKPGKKAKPERKPKKVKGTSKKVNTTCTKSSFTTSLSNLVRKGLCRTEDFQFNGGKIFCAVCSCTVSEAKNMKQHVGSKKHERKSKRCESKDQQRQRGIATQDEHFHSVGTRLQPEVLWHRQEGLKAACKANILLKSMDDLKDWHEEHVKPGLTLGNAKDLPRHFAEPLWKSLARNIKGAMEKCFPEFSFTLDATPTLAEAECIIWRAVAFDLRVIEIVIKLNLFEKKLNVEELANHIIKTIKFFQLQPKNWVSVQLDRAQTNKGAVRIIKDRLPDVDPTIMPCASHGLNNSGEKMSVSAPHAEDHRKQWQKVVQHTGKAREHAKEKFDEDIKLSAGVRFFRKIEQTAQTSQKGLKSVTHDEILPKCRDNKWSEESTKALIASHGTEEKNGELGMAILESATVADVGISHCKACYSLEGDSPLILTANDVFCRLERQLLDGFGTTNIERVVDEALELTLAAEAPLVARRDDSFEVLAAAKEDQLEAEEKVKQLNAAKSDLTRTVPSRTGRVGRRTERTVDTEALGEVKKNLLAAKLSLKEKTERVLEAQALADEGVTAYNAWCAKFPHRTRESLLEHGKSVGLPVNIYYNALFNSVTGDNYNMRQAAKGCVIFDPLFLKGKQNELPMLNDLADKLSHFKFKIMDEAFMEGLKNEIPRVVEQANEEFDWDSIDLTKQYKTRMQGRIKRYNLDPEEELDWKKDPGEKACRIWQWWRMRLLDDTQKFPFFKTALRLVVLVQTSSCAVERVFSRVKMIRDVCGDNMYEDIMECRLFMQCNGDLEDLLQQLGGGPSDVDLFGK